MSGNRIPNGLNFYVAPTTSIKKLVVCKLYDGEFHRNRFEVDSHQARRRFLADLAVKLQRLGVQEIDHEALESLLLAAAVAAERRLELSIAETKAQKQQEQASREFSIPDTEPWPEPVELASILQEAKSLLHRHLVLDD